MAARSLHLEELSPHHADALLDMALEYQREGDDRYAPAVEDIEGFICRHMDISRGARLPKGFVRANKFCLTDGRRIVGTSGLRHELTPALENVGGHIGYDVRPSERGNGYGTLLLRLTLEKARERLPVRRVLVTCDQDNTASERIIRTCGGRLVSEDVSWQTGKPIYQFWIGL